MSETTGTNGGGAAHWNRDALIGLLSLLVIIILILFGVSLTRANDDYVCNDNSIQDQQQGQCTNGSWGPWTTNADGSQQRIYTGTQTLVSFSGGNIVSCSHPSDSIGTSGTITTTYTACEIVQTQPSTGGTGTDTGTGSSGTGGGTGGGSGGTTSTTETVTVGAVISSSQATSSYDYYQAYLDALLATSTITAVPSLVEPGQTTQVSWLAAHVSSCVVTATNTDTWTGLQSPAGGQTSSPINQQTIYTLDCTTAVGVHIEHQAVVNIAPKFQEH